MTKYELNAVRVVLDMVKRQIAENEAKISALKEQEWQLLLEQKMVFVEDICEPVDR